jgi:hypothetical protein
MCETWVRISMNIGIILIPIRIWIGINMEIRILNQIGYKRWGPTTLISVPS